MIDTAISSHPMLCSSLGSLFLPQESVCTAHLFLNHKFCIARTADRVQTVIQIIAHALPITWPNPRPRNVDIHRFSTASLRMMKPKAGYDKSTSFLYRAFLFPWGLSAPTWGVKHVRHDVEKDIVMDCDDGKTTQWFCRSPESSSASQHCACQKHASLKDYKSWLQIWTLSCDTRTTLALHIQPFSLNLTEIEFIQHSAYPD